MKIKANKTPRKIVSAIPAVLLAGMILPCRTGRTAHSGGTHTFTFGSTGESFTLKSKVSGGWIRASGISSSNYTLK